MRELTLESICSEAEFVIVDRQTRAVSEHESARDACLAILQLFARSPDQDYSIYRRSGDKWVAY